MERFIPEGLTGQELDQLLVLLEKINSRKPYGTELFNGLARVSISCAVEAVCLRRALARCDVYMTQRPLDDPAYPGQWHCPGSVMRPGEDVADVFERLEKKELLTPLKSRRFVANVNHPSEERGHFISMVYLCELPRNHGELGRWFPVNNLPDNTVKTHAQRIIPCALGAFLAENIYVCF